jgi:hypothetical protein
MAIWREAKRLLWKDEVKPAVEMNVWNEAENPTPRVTDAEKVHVAPVKPPVAVDADPWGAVKRPRGALNPLKLAVTLFMVVDLVAAVFFVSSNLTITAAALLMFIPNAAFLMLLRSKL